ncbi:TetR/AcrR family transcriptional regulator [Streptomyces sp. NPDC093109]|uniref:TetR/AcrR family transcriptional regulator n=1 Tax=Streptomyces sp. NPDC093109 TaxID=3154977 RepID=UPI00345040B1
MTTTGPGSEGKPQRARYHHGDLRAAVIEASFELLAESGPADFSVARVARRLGVSTAAPYRHFPDRDHLMAAVATQAATELTEHLRQAADRAGTDPAERFAAMAGAYVRYVGDRGAGFNIIFAAGLEKLHDAALAEAGRGLTDLMLALALRATGGGPEAALALLEHQAAASHGYAMLHLDGFFARRRPDIETIADLAVAASRTLLAGNGGGPPPDA